MTENIIQPKCSRGRPERYHDNGEDKRLAYNRQIKEWMLRSPFPYDICSCTYSMASKSKHLRSDKQIKNLNNAQ